MDDMMCAQCGMTFDSGKAYGYACPQGSSCGPIKMIAPMTDHIGMSGYLCVEDMLTARVKELTADLDRANAALILAKETLAALVDEYCDYATINHLGDPERQHNIKRARAALSAIDKLEVL